MIISDPDARIQFEKEISICIKKYSQHIAVTLLQLLPEVAYEFDRTVLNKCSKLVAILAAIKEKGIYEAGIESMDLVELTPAEYKTLSALMEVKGNDVMSMLSIFLFDLKTYKDNVSKFRIALGVADTTLAPPHDKSTAKKLFELACCLNRGDSAIEALSQQDLITKLAILKNSSNTEDKEQYALVMRELKMGDLRDITDLSDEAALQEARRSVADNSQMDKAMVGMREHVADVVDTSKFTKDALQQNPKTGDVNRADTKKSLAKAGLALDKEGPTRRDRMAAELFLRPTITARPDEEYADPASCYDISPMYWPNINAAVVHRTHSDDRPLMTTPNVLAVFRPGATINFADIFRKLGVSHPHKIPAIHPRADDASFEIALAKAKWFNAKIKPASASANANVFGHLGTLEFVDDVKELLLPVHQAGEVSQAFLRHFGAALIPIDQGIPYQDIPPVDLICAEYDFKEDYIPEYVLQIQKGGAYL